MTHEAAEKQQEQEKKARYEKMATAEGAKFVAFQFGTISGLNAAAWAFVKQLVAEAPIKLNPKDLQRELVCAIAVQNARIRRFARNTAE